MNDQHTKSLTASLETLQILNSVTTKHMNPTDS